MIMIQKRGAKKMKQIDVEKLSGLVREHTLSELRENRIGGKEVIVHQNGKCVYHETFGTACAGGQAQAKPLIYRAASMTKSITAAAVAIAADRGLLDLDAPAWDFYPQMKRLQVATVEDGRIVSLRPAVNVIRVRDLLSHTTGLGCSPVVEAVKENTSKMTLHEAIDWMLEKPLAFEPLTQQSYSSTAAFDIAAGIVETVSGLPFDGFLKKYLFDPLRMTDTTFAPNAEQRQRMAPVHIRTPEGTGETAVMPEGCVFENYITARLMAGGGVAATAQDYIRFADMLCAGGVGEDGCRVLSESMVRRMATPNMPEEIDMGCERWGFGMRIVTASWYPHGLGVGCFGWSGFYGTHFWVDPENKLAVVMMKNSYFDGGAGNSSAVQLERDVSEALC